MEWQGFFEDREEDEDWEEGDYGHYSIVTRIDRRSGLITLRDPYPDFWREDRVFRLEWFIRRWWDVNEVPVPETGVLRLVEDRHMLFVITGERTALPGFAGHDAGVEKTLGFPETLRVYRRYPNFQPLEPLHLRGDSALGREALDARRAEEAGDARHAQPAPGPPPPACRTARRDR